MRPIRLLLLLAFFVALPTFLTCLSLFSRTVTYTQPPSAGIPARSSRFRALFSFATPSSLFPPSAIISLTNDNSTFFVARPAAFGPGLPSHGLSGQLWVGKGFGDEALLLEENFKMEGFELGCSDVPGWNVDHKHRPEITALKSKAFRKAESGESSPLAEKPRLSKREEALREAPEEPTASNDGTDDHLHHPLPDSNPASPAKVGEPADVNTKDKTRAPTHADIESLQESADIAGKIVMLSRGGCGFLEKVKWAQRRGGVALIVGDNEPNQPLTIMYAKGDASNVTIPALFTSYNAAHLLSSLVPSEDDADDAKDETKHNRQVSQGDRKGKGRNGKVGGAVFTTTQPDPAGETAAVDAAQDGGSVLQNVLSAVGLVDSTDSDVDDSRRPPSSGNIDWVLLEDWDEDKPASAISSTSTKTQISTKSSKPVTQKGKGRTTSNKGNGDDDFIIGVQDWRDTEVIAQPTSLPLDGKQKLGNNDKKIHPPTAAATGKNTVDTTLKGGSITPGSGEYVQDQEPKAKNRHSKQSSSNSSKGSNMGTKKHRSLTEKIRNIFHHGKDDGQSGFDNGVKSRFATPNLNIPNVGKLRDKPQDRDGLWVTLTPTIPSTSPFFDTLLVLVVSPLVTLTVVYGLLLLRSRIRRRRWRAPKSIVEQLPVRTYHTMTSTSSTTSSQLGSPHEPTDTSPLLRPISARPRPRSQTTTGVVTSSPMEKNSPRQGTPPKRYMGRQIECVVCLEEYVDGESQVMSLPCGHEFHVECITPWLVTRRRTCPICKGDVVRSITRSSPAVGTPTRIESDLRHGNEQTSDDIQERVAETVNEDASAAIPIPVREGELSNEDIEQGNAADAPLPFESRSTQQGPGWRGIFGGSSSRLSGETVWGATPNDRTR